MQKDTNTDSAYKSKRTRGEGQEEGVEYSVCERPYRNKSLTEEQKERNIKLSRVRSMVEHGDRCYKRDNRRT